LTANELVEHAGTLIQQRIHLHRNQKKKFHNLI